MCRTIRRNPSPRTPARSARPRSRGTSGTASEVQDESRRARPRDADHHAVSTACSSSSSTESRWSGSPSSTGDSQVPQVPSAHEESTPTPASSTTSRIERSGGTVRVSSLWASYDLERLGAGRRGEWLGAEPLDVQGRAASRCSAPRRRSAAVRGRSSRRGCPPAACPAAWPGRAARSRPAGDGDPVAVAGQLVEEGHRRPLPAAVDEPPLGACGLGGGDHRQDRGDADSTGDEQVLRRRHQWEVVARSPHADRVADLELVVDVERASAAVRVAKDAEAPQVVVVGVDQPNIGDITKYSSDGLR